MFQFTGFPSIRYGLAYGYLESIQVGFPIRIPADQWIFALPAAFRSLSRPSSALSAKASTLRSFLFDLPVLLAFKTGGSLAVSFHRVYNVMSSYCFDSLSLKDNSSDVSFSYL